MMTTKITTPLEGALWLASQGFLVFPLRPNTSSPKEQKKPLQAGWQESATNDAEKIRAIGKNFPGCNWGLYCGGSGIFAADLDNKETEDGRIKTGTADWEHLQQKHGNAPETLTIRTPSGGLHLIYFGSGKSTVETITPSIDTRGYGGYLVAVGSVIYNPEGEEIGRYTLETDAPVAPVPPWLPELANSKANKLERPDDDFVEGSIPDGRRDTVLTQWAGVLRGQGLTPNEMEAALLAINGARCSPPLPDSEVLKIAHSIGKKPRDTAKAIADFGTVEERLDRSSPIRLNELKGDAPPRQWILRDWLPVEEIGSLYGSGGQGKSLLALQLAVAVASGGKFLGMEIENRMPVLYVACEDNKDELKRRKHSIMSAPEFDFNTGENEDDVPLYLWPRAGEENALAKEEGSDVVAGPFVEEVRTWFERKDFGRALLILDTLSDVYLGSEIVRERVNKFIKMHLGGLAKEFNLTILLLAHPSRAGMNTGDMLSGSTAWENAVRNRLTLARSKDNPDITELTRAKTNYAKVGEQILIEWEHGRFIVTGKPAVAETQEEKDVREAVLRKLKSKPGEYLAFTIARGLIEDDPHLFGGQSPETIRRRIEKVFGDDGVRLGESLYVYSEDKDSGGKTRRILTVTVSKAFQDTGVSALSNLDESVQSLFR